MSEIVMLVANLGLASGLVVYLVYKLGSLFDSLPETLAVISQSQRTTEKTLEKLQESMNKMSTVLERLATIMDILVSERKKDG